jgi:hypothetical protein
MVMIALCSSLIGAVLGIRFRVQVLFPVATFGLLTVAAVTAFKGTAVSSAILASIISVTSLQIGYLGGLFTRFFMTASRVTSLRSLPSTTVRN